MHYFGLLRSNQKMTPYVDGVVFGVGGLAHLFPAVLAPLTGLVLVAPVTVQMLVGALGVARVVDMLWVK